MPKNDPLSSAENIVQLPSARRALVPASRAQPMPPVLFPSWVVARDRAAAALLGGAQRLLLTGPPGTGKTVLIEHVARVLRAAGRTVSVQLADADPDPPEAGTTLFVDEADRLSAPKLKRLLDEAAGTLVLIGLAPLTRRVAAGTVQLTLDPLDHTEAREYIAEWLALNGRTPAELDSKAVRVLAELSGGVPRLLSTLLSAGAWLAKSNGAPVIQAAHIQEAAELRSVLGPPLAPADEADAPSRSRRLLWAGVLTGIVLVAAAGAITPRLFPAEATQVAVLAAPYLHRVEQWFDGEPSPAPRIEQATVPTPPHPPATPVAAVPVEAPPPPAAPPPAAPEPVQHDVAPAPVPEPVQAAAEPARVDPAPVETAPPPTPAPPEVAPPNRARETATAPPAVAAPASTLPADTIELLLRRGREMLALNDVSAARLFLLRAAEGGSSEAMFEVGRTYDPAILTAIGAARQGDRAEALRWYRRAAENGNHAAERVLAPQ